MREAAFVAFFQQHLTAACEGSSPFRPEGSLVFLLGPSQPQASIEPVACDGLVLFPTLGTPGSSLAGEEAALERGDPREEQTSHRGRKDFQACIVIRGPRVQASATGFVFFGPHPQSLSLTETFRLGFCSWSGIVPMRIALAKGKPRQ